jgi:hypothetical protein
MEAKNEVDHYVLYPIFEEEAKLFGMAMSNFLNIAILIILQVMAPMLLGAFGIEIGFWFILISIVIDIALWIFFKNMGKKAYPNFLFAWLSYAAMQPKNLSCEKTTITWPSVSDYIEQQKEIEEKKQNKDENT